MASDIPQRCLSVHLFQFLLLYIKHGKKGLSHGQRESQGVFVGSCDARTNTGTVSFGARISKETICPILRRETHSDSAFVYFSSCQRGRNAQRTSRSMGLTARVPSGGGAAAEMGGKSSGSPVISGNHSKCQGTTVPATPTALKRRRSA